MTCAICGRDIRRVFVGNVEGYGHVTNPGPAHHYAKPAVPPRPDQQTRRKSVRLPLAGRTSAASLAEAVEP